eukprot:1977866-Heterocapsa_arctica.AAC.1
MSQVQRRHRRPGACHAPRGRGRAEAYEIPQRHRRARVRGVRHRQCRAHSGNAARHQQRPGMDE